MVENLSAEERAQRPIRAVLEQHASTPSGRSKLLRWIRKGGFAVADQGLVSASNFVISIVLARWLDAEQYGAFATVFALFLLLSMLYQCLLLEPMAVFGGGVYRRQLRGYLRSLLWIQVAISLVIIVALGAAAALAQWRHVSGGMAGALVGIAVAAPCILTFWLARRGCYLQASSGTAAGGAVFYCLCVMGGFWAIREMHQLSTLAAFLVIGVAALLTSVLLLFSLARSLDRGGAAPPVRETWVRHWEYGRWALGGSVASWIPAYIYFPLLGNFAGLASAGDLKALMNLAAPLTQVQAAFSMLLLPYAARAHDQGGHSKVVAMAKLLTWASLALGLAYWALIAIFPGFVFRALYSGKYMSVSHLVPLVAVGSVLWTGTFGCSIAMRALERPKLIFIAYGISAGLSLLVGVPTTWAYGLAGSIWGINVSDAAAFVLLLAFMKWMHGKPGRPRAGAVLAQDV